MTQTPPASSDIHARLDQLERALDDERAARMRAESEKNAKSELLAMVSHEVRTPMGAIISMAELLLGTNLGERQRHYAETLVQSSRSLLSLLNEILDYSKLEAGRFELDPVSFDLPGLMRNVGSMLEARATEKGLASSLELADGFPAQLVGDPVRITQILDNLIDNAVKFTDQGSVRVLAGYGRDGTDIVLRFEVHDTGVGLSPQQIDHLFKPYEQADSSVAVKYGGTGLGLSIARQLVQLMGGDLGVESSTQCGSMFWFTLRLSEAERSQVEISGAQGTLPDHAAPLDHASSPEQVAPPEQTSLQEHPATSELATRQDHLVPPEPAAPPEHAAKPGLTATPGAANASLGPLSGHVLIVEDNDINQMLIAAYLEQFGLSYETAVNGEEAVNMVQERHFDVVLMDIMMPVMDGLMATRQIRNLSGPVASIQIIALTAHAMQGDRENYLGAGMDGYVSKPVRAADLFSALSEHLGIEPQGFTSSA